MRAARPRFQAFAGVAGLSLHNWYSNHRFCGQCAVRWLTAMLNAWCTAVIAIR